MGEIEDRFKMLMITDTGTDTGALITETFMQNGWTVVATMESQEGRESSSRPSRNR
ncbi:hypothetical protein [Desulfospira joergensenii]|uniref:hypothetical protein n=1 Tax=Desulfospira joergensenii TaxID=53329 RepID=UPI00129467B2|nr:hypothetical protein [Desulfospira joergensenii]